MTMPWPLVLLVATLVLASCWLAAAMEAMARRTRTWAWISTGLGLAVAALVVAFFSLSIWAP